MRTGKLVFAQLTDHLPLSYDGEHKIKRFTCPLTLWSVLPDHGGAGESGAHCYIFSAMIFDTAEHEGMDG